jgi:hypothetical protein
MKLRLLFCEGEEYKFYELEVKEIGDSSVFVRGYKENARGVDEEG